MLPKPYGSQIPLLVRGGGQQSGRWIAENSDGWMIYPGRTFTQAQVVNRWRKYLIETQQVN